MSDDVTLSFPADTANVRLARTIAAAMAARADLPVDQLEDVRLAVDEAVSQLVGDAESSTIITCVFTLTGDGLEIIVSGHTRTGAVPSTGTFSWTVLSALVDSVSASSAGRRVTLTLRVVRHIPVDA
ncbi:MAG: ATP-binding protein [Actinomycetes bacterium]